jgi:hypothetical protein
MPLVYPRGGRYTARPCRRLLREDAATATYTPIKGDLGERRVNSEAVILFSPGLPALTGRRGA